MLSFIAMFSKDLPIAKAEYEIASDQDALDQFTENGFNSEIANVSDNLYQKNIHGWIA